MIVKYDSIPGARLDGDGRWRHMEYRYGVNPCDTVKVKEE